MDKPNLIAGVCLGGPCCGLEIECPMGPDTILMDVRVPDVPGVAVHAYAWYGSTEKSSGRWIWRHLHFVGTKGGVIPK